MSPTMPEHTARRYTRGMRRFGLPQGPRHRERLRAAARRRRHRHGDLAPGAGRARCATGGPASAATACCGWSAPRVRRPGGRRGPRRGRVVHGLPQRRRLASRRCAATGSGSSAATSSSTRASTRAGRCRSPPARGTKVLDLRRRPASASTWARRSCTARPRSRSAGAVLAGAARLDGQPARGRLRRRPRRRRHAARRRPGTTRRSTPTASTSSSSYAAATRHVAMRVHERGSGETRSCGTGACAVMVAAALADGRPAAGGTTYRVDVPGGRLDVTWTASGRSMLDRPGRDRRPAGRSRRARRETRLASPAAIAG